MSEVLLQFIIGVGALFITPQACQSMALNTRRHRSKRMTLKSSRLSCLSRIKSMPCCAFSWTMKRTLCTFRREYRRREINGVYINCTIGLIQSGSSRNVSARGATIAKHHSDTSHLRNSGSPLQRLMKYYSASSEYTRKLVKLLSKTLTVSTRPKEDKRFPSHFRVDQFVERTHIDAEPSKLFGGSRRYIHQIQAIGE